MVDHPSNSTSSTSSMLGPAIQLNNHGAMLLEQGEYRSACDTLCTALKVIRGQCHPGTSTSVTVLLPTAAPTTTANKTTTKTKACQHHHTTQDGGSATKRRASRRPKCNTRCQSSERSSSSSFSCQEQQESLDYVFRSPLRLAPEEEQEEEDRPSLFSISSAILFNLGLSQFLRAIDSYDDETSRPKRLEAALQLFEMVYVLEDSAVQNKNEEEENKEGGGGTQHIPLLHLMGMVNNCAQAHKLLNQPEKADRLLQHVLTTLMVVVVDKNNTSSEDLQQCLEGFFAATSHLVLRNKGSMAEAA